jgi:transaldolase
MKLFLDTVDIEKLKYWHNLGLIDGVTTNPTSLSKITDKLEVIREIVSLMQDKDVSVQLTSTSLAEQLLEADKYCSFGKNVVIKVPGIQTNLELAKKLVAKNIKVNVTLVFTPMQAALFAKLGVDYVSFFVGRLIDQKVDAIKLLQQTVDLVNIVGHKTQVLAASIRNSDQLVQAYLAGADIVTVAPEVLAASINHQLIDSGYKIFLQDALLK